MDSGWWTCAEDAEVCDIAGYRIRVARAGALARHTVEGRPDIFLVHGMADSGDTWQPLLGALADCNVWIFELPWSGCDGVAWSHVMSATDWWHEALALCPVRPTVCIGHSFGATVLLDWLAAHPESAPDGMLAVSPFYCSPRREVRWDEIDAFARGAPGRLGRALSVRMGHARPNDEVLDAMAAKLAERVVPDAMLELFRLFLKSRAWPLAGLDFPLAVVVGEHDAPLVIDGCIDLAARLPLATFTRFASCGHHPMHEQPRRLRDLVRTFIDAVLAPDLEIHP